MASDAKVCPVMSPAIPMTMDGGMSACADMFLQPCIGSRCAWWMHMGRDHDDQPVGACGQVSPLPDSTDPFAHVASFRDPAGECEPTS